MKKVAFAAFFLCAFASQCARSVHAQNASDVPYADCALLAQTWIVNLTTTPQVMTAEQAADSLLNASQHVTCFATMVPSISRTSALRALAESFGNSMQQSSPAGSSGATSSVSKPTGSTSLIQDVGGVSATSNGSALTLQFAPGDLVQQMAAAGVIDFCTSTIQTKGCKSTVLLKVLAPATFSVTANTTSPGSSVTGTTASAGTAVPATLKSLSNTLSFGGVTAKYGFLYKKKTSDGTAQSSAASKEAEALGELMNKLANCSGYTGWTGETRANAIKAMQTAQNQKDPNALLNFILRSYRDLASRLYGDPTCKDSVSAALSALNTVSAFQAAIAAQQVLAASSTPLLGVEYDFSTPANKPSYHSAKLNFSWQSTVSCTTQVQAAATRALKKGRPNSTPQDGMTATCNTAKGKSTTTSPSSAPTSATPSWTVSASGGADIYSDEPSSTIPAASRLRDVQAGAEVARVWHISEHTINTPALADLLSKMGDLSLVGAYYYQDQTSPSILNGPPSSITFNGLPTTASQVFATRGPINVGQVRLGFGTGTNLRFPVAVSYSNRSDLIVHPFVGVQFGVSYDLFGK